MKKKSDSPDVAEHPIAKFLLSHYQPLWTQESKLKAGEVLKLDQADWCMWNSAKGFFRLIAHLSKLDQCLYYLKLKGPVGRVRRNDYTYITETNWIEYNIGYYYTLHRSIYDCMLWFIHNSLGLQIEVGPGFETKLMKQLEKWPNLEIIVPLKSLKMDCDKYKDTRNEHVHRGSYVRSSPIMGNLNLDRFMVYMSLNEVFERMNLKSMVPPDGLDPVAFMRVLRADVTEELINQINVTHSLVCKCLDSIHRYLVGYIAFCEEHTEKTTTE